MDITIILLIGALVLTIIDIVLSRARSFLGWGVLLIIIALLIGRVVLN